LGSCQDETNQEDFGKNKDKYDSLGMMFGLGKRLRRSNERSQGEDRRAKTYEKAMVKGRSLTLEGFMNYKNLYGT
jgi:hypothetical protein